MRLSLCRDVHSFYETRLLLKEFNKTNIVLIPKCHNPTGIHQFRAISLCNFVYKFISQTIVNKLKSWMHSLILADQTAFVSNRTI